MVLLPELHKRRSMFRMIDDDPISVDELIDAWKVVKGKDEDARHFRFHILMLTKIPLSEPAMVQELDFSSCGLSTVDLSKYINLIKLSLANNNFTSLIKTVNFGSLEKLRGFDMSHNDVKDLDEIVALVRGIPNLQVLMTYGNPCFESGDPDTIRIDFLAKVFTFVQPQKLALVYLNGKRVTTREKCSALTKTKTILSKEAIEAIRLEMAIKEMNAKSDDTEIDLSNFDFVSLTMLNKRMPHLTTLNLSNNRLQSLEADVIKGLPNLTHLDISHNQISSLKEIVEVLKGCPNLESVVLLLSTQGKETAVVKDYAFDLFKKLKGLVTVDGMKNPFGTVANRREPVRSRMSIARPMEHSPSQGRVDRSRTMVAEDIEPGSLAAMYSKNIALADRVKSLNRPQSKLDLWAPDLSENINSPAL